MLLGFVSLYLVHAVARHRLGAVPSWVGVLGVLALVSVGVYLGRVKRWNSWDLLTQPGARLAQLHAHLGDPASLTRAVRHQPRGRPACSPPPTSSSTC